MSTQRQPKPRSVGFKTGQPTARQQLKFGLLDNGLDYLLSAAEQAKLGDARSLKCSILHLFDGLELLLKARLAKELYTVVNAC